jgi:hypothetical protein
MLRKLGVSLSLSLIAAMSFIAPAAFAVGPDFSSITTGLDASTVVTAVIAAAAILATVGFAKWGAKKLGRFFG